MPLTALYRCLRLSQNPHIRPGQKKGTCHHWVVDPVYLLNASKANYELELRLAEIDVSIQRIEDSIVTKQEVMGELEDERDELESGSERNNINQRIRRASESLEKLNKIKARLVNDKEALQAAVDGAAAEGDDYVERAKWTWVTADNILEDISGVNELHPKYTVASHTGIYTDNHSKAKEAQGKRLCAVASLALADDAHDLTSETQNVIVSVTLMAFINSQWRCAVQSEDNPPGRVMKINKTAWRQRQYAKVAEQAEDGLNR